LSRLAHDDPAAFERLREELLDELISRAPDRLKARLRGLQFRVDQVRTLAHTPLNATIRVSELMWKSFLALSDELSGRAPPPKKDSPARVIDLRRAASPRA
jgi:hypothetical protein